MKGQITIRGDGGEIELRIFGRERAEADNLEDLDWLQGSLYIKAGPFSGAFELSLGVSELVALQDDLEATLRSLRGWIHFATLEGNWKLDVAFETSGAAIVTGSVTANPAVDNALNYEFRSDPISLEQFARDIRSTIEIYAAPRNEQLLTKVTENS